MTGEAKCSNVGRRDRGFTLIEVLAALLIFSLSILGLMQAGSQSVRALSALENKMLAGIVADNVLVTARHSPLHLGTQSGRETQMGRTYDWTLVTETTDLADFYRLRAAIRAEGNTQILITRIAYRPKEIKRPVQPLSEPPTSEPPTEPGPEPQPDTEPKP